MIIDQIYTSCLSQASYYIESDGEAAIIDPSREVDHFKIDYDPTTTDNPWKLAYTHLKSSGSLSSVSDA